MDEHKILALIKKAQAWDLNAKQDIILEFYHPVEQIAKAVARIWVDFMDLIGEWLLWVEHAIMNYNAPDTNIFWNYARYRVRKKMFDFITSRQSIIQKPKDFVADHQRYIRCYTDFFNEVGRDPTLQELKAMLGWWDKKFNSFTSILTNKQPDRFIGDADPSNYEPAVDFQLDDFETKFQKELIHGFINTTNNPNERIILTFRLEGRTLAYIGQQLGISHERVRQVLDTCFKKLKRMYAWN